MNDFADAIISLLKNLGSPQGAVKLLFIGVFLILSWIYIQPLLLETTIHVDHIPLIILVISTGMGSLLGSVIFWIYNHFQRKKKKKTEDALALKVKEDLLVREKEDEEKENNLIVQKLESLIRHLSLEQKETLWRLSTSNITMYYLEEDYKIFLDSGYIKKLGETSRGWYLVQLNPALKAFLKSNLAEHQKLRVDHFFETDNKAEEKLELLDVNSSNRSVSEELLNSMSVYEGCIRGGTTNGDYSVWFDKFMREEFERRKERSYEDMISFPPESVVRSS